MSAYRVSFHDEGGICGRTDFDAEGDDMAADIAEQLADSCRDKCKGYRLWRGTRQLLGVSPLSPAPATNLDQLRDKTQAVIVDRELALKDSALVIASSRRLPARLAEHKSLPQRTEV